MSIWDNFNFGTYSNADLSVLTSLQIRTQNSCVLTKLEIKMQEILKEANEMKGETEKFKIQLGEMEENARSIEETLEYIRRERNRAAVILWNFPYDLHSSITRANTADQKIDSILDFLIGTISVPETDVICMCIQHVEVFYTSYKNQRSVNVRVQFADEEGKIMCQSKFIPFLKVFNQSRDTPTRWKDDQTEQEREEITKQIQQQPQRPTRLMYSKMIRWPPPINRK